jgi:hypothetical protein
MNRQWRLLKRLPGKIWRLLWQQVLPALAYLASFLRSPRQTLSVWPEEGIRIGPRVALFVHFDADGAVQPHVLQYLSALVATGLTVVFVTNSGHLGADAMAVLRGLCAGVIVRRNVGYDFGAVRETIERIGLPRPDTEFVLLANDSVYGPLQPLGPLLERMDFDRADLWGMTESWQTRYHLQSYFVAFGRAALTSPAWPAFWHSVRPVSSKWWIIRHYEIGLTQRFLRAGLRARALWRYQDLVGLLPAMDVAKRGKDAGTEVAADPNVLGPLAKARLAHARQLEDLVSERWALNPTSDFWRHLLESGFPFLKRELLCRNPTFVQDVVDWRDVVRSVSSVDLEAIERDLQRTMRNRAP